MKVLRICVGLAIAVTSWSGLGSHGIAPAAAPALLPVTPPIEAEAGRRVLLLDSTAQATAQAVRVNPPPPGVPPIEGPPTPDCANPAGLFCLPFAPGGLSLCEDMMWYEAQQTAPLRLGDQPQSGPKRQLGIGWRESNCKNTAQNCSTGRCYSGYFQIGAGNINASGYKASGLFSWCGVYSVWDYFGSGPLQKQKSVCIAIGLWNYHLALGQDPAWEVWDRWL